MPDDNALERLSKKLDSGSTPAEMRRASLFSRGLETKVPNAWENEPEKPKMASRKRRPTITLEMIFGASLVFFVVALVVAGLIVFFGNNTISTKNVDVSVTGPSEISAGSTLSMQVVITNRNAVPMELTDLIVEFPTGTRSDTDVSKDLPRIREPIGTIKPGESINRTVRATIFGQAGTNISIKASAEYHIPSSNAVFVSDSVYATKINQSPAAITVDALKETVSGQEATVSISLVSNALENLTDVLLLADYPPGFSFESSTPAPVAGTAAWSLGDIEPGGKRTISIKGVFTGEDGDSKVIHFTAGSRKDGQNDAIVAPLASSEVALTVTKPFVSVALSLDGSVADSHTISRGKEVKGAITWTNNLPTRVQDVEITLSLKGTILDKESVKASKGFYSSNNSSILWSKETDPDLSDVGPGESKVFDFSFAAFPPAQGAFKNPELALSVDIAAKRQTESNVPELIHSSAATKALVSSDVALSASLSHSGGGGPIPPKADTETTYTVTWVVSNSANALANASVSAVLPSYVRFIPGGNANITFNPSGKIVTWTIGDIPAGQSMNTSFVVGVTPSVSQIDSQPSVVGSQRLYAFDRFVRADLEMTAPSLTTSSGAASGRDGIVVK